MIKHMEIEDTLVYDKYIVKNSLQLEKVRKNILKLYPKPSLFETRNGFPKVDGDETIFFVDLLFEVTLVNNVWKVSGNKEFESKVEKVKKILNNNNMKMWNKMRKVREYLTLPEGFPVVLVLGYSVARFVEDIPSISVDEDEPEVVFRVYKKVIKYNNSNENVEINILKKSSNSNEKDDFEEILQTLTIDNKDNNKIEEYSLGDVKDFTLKEDYYKWVKRAKEYINCGDIYQVQICRHAVSNSEIKAVDLYEKLTSINQAPYMYYIELENQYVISSSPELMFRCKNGVSQTRPIAGTMSKDDSRENCLAEIPKEAAEHLMLVDLARNDLSRCAVKGGINVTSLMKLESYGSLDHLVSTVETKVREECDIFDLIQANFPAGTMTGAPKVRAMEIIAELEKKPRGLFSGCAGYISGKNEGVFALTIRTIIGNPGNYKLRAAAGIVADSQAASEWKEAGNKINAFAKAVGGNV